MESMANFVSPRTVANDKARLGPKNEAITIAPIITATLVFNTPISANYG